MGWVSNFRKSVSEKWGDWVLHCHFLQSSGLKWEKLGTVEFVHPDCGEGILLAAPPAAPPWGEGAQHSPGFHRVWSCWQKPCLAVSGISRFTDSRFGVFLFKVAWSEPSSGFTNGYGPLHLPWAGICLPVWEAGAVR